MSTKKVKDPQKALIKETDKALKAIEREQRSAKKKLEKSLPYDPYLLTFEYDAQYLGMPLNNIGRNLLPLISDLGTVFYAYRGDKIPTAPQKMRNELAEHLRTLRVDSMIDPAVKMRNEKTDEQLVMDVAALSYALAHEARTPQRAEAHQLSLNALDVKSREKKDALFDRAYKCKKHLEQDAIADAIEIGDALLYLATYDSSNETQPMPLIDYRLVELLEANSGKLIKELSEDNRGVTEKAESAFSDILRSISILQKLMYSGTKKPVKLTILGNEPPKKYIPTSVTDDVPITQELIDEIYAAEGSRLDALGAEHSWLGRLVGKLWEIENKERSEKTGKPINSKGFGDAQIATIEMLEKVHLGKCANVQKLMRAVGRSASDLSDKGAVTKLIEKVSSVHEQKAQDKLSKPERKQISQHLFDYSNVPINTFKDNGMGSVRSRGMLPRAELTAEFVKMHIYIDSTDSDDLNALKTKAIRQITNILNNKEPNKGAESSVSGIDAVKSAPKTSRHP